MKSLMISSRPYLIFDNILAIRYKAIIDKNIPIYAINLFIKIYPTFILPGAGYSHRRTRDILMLKYLLTYNNNYFSDKSEKIKYLRRTLPEPEAKRPQGWVLVFRSLRLLHWLRSHPCLCNPISTPARTTLLPHLLYFCIFIGWYFSHRLYPILEYYLYIQ